MYDGEEQPQIVWYNEEKVQNQAVPPLHSYYNIKDSEIVAMHDDNKAEVASKRRRTAKNKKRAVPPSGNVFDLPPEYFSPDFEDPTTSKRREVNILL